MSGRYHFREVSCQDGTVREVLCHDISRTARNTYFYPNSTNEVSKLTRFSVICHRSCAVRQPYYNILGG